MSLLGRCPHFRGCYVQSSMELGPEDVSLLERCPHFRGCYIQSSMELGPEDVYLLERCPHFRGCEKWSTHHYNYYYVHYWGCGLLLKGWQLVSLLKIFDKEWLYCLQD